VPIPTRAARVPGRRQSTETVTRLLAAGADPDAGGQSARATATFFDLSAMVELLDAR
jgi:uncharacterized protein